jgi:2-polyprenyl-6-methoxyphenol hydroxylase-like FAD-dependent oxidoreductase
MPTKTVLISGAGVAGPTLAYWLLRRGFTPVIVERAPQFRSGGYIVDFFGVGFDVAERMGLVPLLRELGYVNDRAEFVDEKGRRRSGFEAEALRRAFGDRFLSIQRGDLARVIYEKVRGQIETIFDDEIVQLKQWGGRVDVGFKNGGPRSFDIVVGADGLHSRVRSLTFAAIHERYLGYYAAVFLTSGYSRRDEHTYLSYAAPGKQISRFALRDDETGFLFVFAKKDSNPRFAEDRAEQKRLLLETFSDIGWVEWPEIKKHLETAHDLYFDAVSQIELQSWSMNRIALVGDAAHCPSLLAGEGSSFAMAGAYILAGELGRFVGDHIRAFPAYERRFRPFIERKQKSARGLASSFTPETSFGLGVRDFVLRLTAIPAVADWLLGRFGKDRFSLPSY